MTNISTLSHPENFFPELLLEMGTTVTKQVISNILVSFKTDSFAQRYQCVVESGFVILWKILSKNFFCND